MGPRNTHPQEEILEPHNTHNKKFWTHKIGMKENLAPTKHPQEEILEP